MQEAPPWLLVKKTAQGRNSFQSFLHLHSLLLTESMELASYDG